jgi:hypothetical protein
MCVWASSIFFENSQKRWIRARADKEKKSYDFGASVYIGG